MRGLISDLLDVGRIESGMLKISPESSEVANLVDRAKNTFLSGGARHAVLIDLPPDLPPVMADRRHILQVLTNLFDNAARHSPESSPIRVAAERSGIHVAITVSDAGSGIAPDRLLHLFRKYAQIGSEAARREIGNSLGLAICKGLVEAHGGRIWAESSGAGKGAQFTFTIPVAEEFDMASGTVPDSSSMPERGRRQASILVVDDDPKILRYVRDTLTAASYNVSVISDPEELFRILPVARPQLVLLDLMLPGGRRHRDYEAHFGVVRFAGHLHFCIWTGRNGRASARSRR